MTIESRQAEVHVDFEAIESIQETKDGRMQLTYFLPNKEGTGFNKKTEIYDCFEIDAILKVF